MKLGVFIDLNCYRFTNEVFDNLMQELASRNIIHRLVIYNYSPLLHKTFNFPQTARLHNSLSGRRKVMIDIRQICDIIEYATLNQCCYIYTLNAMVDSAPFFDKLQELKANVTLATPTPIKANVNNYHYLTRTSTMKEGHFHIKNILNCEQTDINDTVKSESQEKLFGDYSQNKIVQLVENRHADTIENLHSQNGKTEICMDNKTIMVEGSKANKLNAIDIDLKVNDLNKSDGKPIIDYSTADKKLDISTLDIAPKQNLESIKNYINSVTAKTNEPMTIEKKHFPSDYDIKLKELEKLISNLYN